MPMKKDKTTVTISKVTMRKLNAKAVAANMAYSDYLDKLIRDYWKGRIDGEDPIDGKTNNGN